jgi:hypothetical protein
VTAWRAAAGIAAAVVFLLSWWAIHHTFWHDHELVDTPIYEQYGDAMRAGEVPYRDFKLEYPPGALPAFLAPELTAKPADFGAYGRAFTRWMRRCGMVMMLLCAAALAALGASLWRTIAALGLIAVSPMLLGVVYLSRFDLWPAMLTAGALAALLCNRDRLGAGVLAAAISVKLYAAVLVPLGFVWVWRRRGPRDAVIWSAVFVGVLAAIFLPWAVISPGGLGHALGTQLARPLQIESLGAAILLWAHHLGGLAITVHTDHGSQNIRAAGSNAVAGLTTALQLGVLIAVWAAFAAGPPRRERLVTASAAALAAFIAFGKVFSPQFMIWLVPLVPLVRSRVAWALLAASLVLTQAWFPDRYWLLAVQLGRVESGLVLARDLVVAALTGVLLYQLLRTRDQATAEPPPRSRRPQVPAPT